MGAETRTRRSEDPCTLDIVRAVADEWGIDGDNTTRTIWARFDCPE